MSSSAPVEPDRPVAIQVGGRTFATRLSTLRRFPESLLWRAYSFNEKSFDLVFWDRNPRIFESLLDYYRTGRLAFPADVDFSTFKQELLFWGFDVGAPERPPWPILPLQKKWEASSGDIRCPLGVAWRDASSSCHHVVVCLVWSALGRCSSVWEVAQKGYRSVTIYWKTRAPGVDFSLLKSHFKTLKRLAEMDACKITLFPEAVPAAMLGVDVRTHDLYTNGHIHTDPQSSHVALWKFRASYRKDGHELVMKGLGDQTFKFDYKGFRVEMHVSGENVWWYMDPLKEGDVLENENVDVSMIDNAQGFLLDVSFVINRTVFPGFSFPSCYYRTSILRADIFMGQTFTDIPDDPAWFLAPGRHDLTYETSPFEFLEHQAYKEDVELTVLIEEKTHASLVCHPATNIVPYASASSIPPTSYDKMLIAW